jgi:hypothetical protein
MFVPAAIVELGALMNDLEANPSVKLVVFRSIRAPKQLTSHSADRQSG